MKDFYYILGTDANSTLNEIKEAYRKLSKKFHPDLNQGDKYFEDRFREIKEAYDTLSDPAKRSRYDAALKKSRSNAAEEHQKRQYYREQNKNQQFQTRPSAFNKPKTKGPGLGMTIVLILLGLIAAVYLVESFSNSRARKANVAATVSTASLKTHKQAQFKN
jgi:DnaJ-class molecular chaperone